MARIEKRKIWMSLIMVPPIILLIALGPSAILHLMVILATFFGLQEYYNLTLPHSRGAERVIGMVLGLILSILISFGNARGVSPFLVLVILILSMLSMATPKDLPTSISKMGIILFGVFYIAFLLAYVSLIRNKTDGRLWVLFLITTVWSGDIFALLIGSSIGRHKLYPRISPNKTYEGLGGAMIGSIIVALSFSFFFLPHLDKKICIFLAIGLGILGQFGDFTESMLKRSAQVKDSGTLIPGHGGMLDRIDSFLFSAPFLHYSLLYLLKEIP